MRAAAAGSGLAERKESGRVVDRRSSVRSAGSAEAETTTPSGIAPQTLRQYALLADGERGALIGPHGDLCWMCAPRWEDDAVFSALVGGEGHCTITPADPWFVWGGFYEARSLIWRSRWVSDQGVTECREALALPATPERAVILRRVLARKGAARVRVGLDARAGFGEAPMEVIRAGGHGLLARTGNLFVHLAGIDPSVLAPDGRGGVEAVITVPEGASRDLVITVGGAPPGEAPDPDELWRTTEERWRAAVPTCDGLAAPRDASHAYAVLRGLTSADGGMVAAVTTSLPEHAEEGRDYDYRYAWIRDQCYAGIAVGAHGPHPLLDAAVRYVGERLLADGPQLRPAYTTRGDAVPDERKLGLRGYPGSTDIVGNKVNRQHQLDVFGEALQLFAAAARLDRLDADGRAAAELAVKAIAQRWQEPDAGIWELEDRFWTQSRLSCVAGLHAATVTGLGGGAVDLEDLAASILDATNRRCLHPQGWWKRADDDDRVDAALLLPPVRGALPADDPRTQATLRQVERRLTRDGYVYRFRHGDGPLDQAEGAFLLCGFITSLAALHQGRRIAAFRWFERARTACGPPGLFAEEYDATQRQLRGNLPQAFVHAMLLECSVRLAGLDDDGGPDLNPSDEENEDDDGDTHHTGRHPEEDSRADHSSGQE